jgi:hypothetical protein
MRFPLDTRSTRDAAHYGQLNILKWLRGMIGCKLEENTCRIAARNGHFEVLQWLRENGCSWDEDTCSYAAENGHLEVLKSHDYLIEGALQMWPVRENWFPNPGATSALNNAPCTICTNLKSSSVGPPTHSIIAMRIQVSS